ncbi:hypothetical protein N2603_38625 [Bradyrhizobium huanghuaihaiense]|nr:hypothetical protein [Bradyrhizobium sp. CB3035]UWU75817.1 hypothetical protein N2603_38625 [Bradyrhizobium sp. CB3035]
MTATHFSRWAKIFRSMLFSKTMALLSGGNTSSASCRQSTYGMIALIAEVDGKKIAFIGDLMTRGGKLYQLHAMEYAHGDLLGVEFTMQSILALKKEGPEAAYPSHGAPISEVKADVERLESRLETLANVGRLFTSGYGSPFKDRETLRESRLQRIAEHLLWAGSYTCSNFYVVLSGSGHAMLIDCGLATAGHAHAASDHGGSQALRFIEHHIDQLGDDYGVRDIELVVPTTFTTIMSAEYLSFSNISRPSAGRWIASLRLLPILLHGRVRHAASTNRSKCNGSCAMVKHFTGEESIFKFIMHPDKANSIRWSFVKSTESGLSLEGTICFCSILRPEELSAKFLSRRQLCATAFS